MRKRKQKTIPKRFCQVTVDWSLFTEHDYRQMFDMETGTAGIVRLQEVSFSLQVRRATPAGRTQLMVEDLLFARPDALNLPTSSIIQPVLLVNWENEDYLHFQQFLSCRLEGYYDSEYRRERQRMLINSYEERLVSSLDPSSFHAAIQPCFQGEQGKKLYPATFGAVTLGNCRFVLRRLAGKGKAGLLVSCYLPCQYEDKGTYFFDVHEVKEASIKIPASPALRSLTFSRLLDMLCQKIIQLPLSSPVHQAVYDEGFWTGVPMP